MKNTCPQCSTAYNVTAAAIGRKVTCKNCNSALVVTEAGLEYQNAPAPRPAAAPAGGAFDFDAAPTEEAAPRKSKPARSTQRDESEDGGRGRRESDDDDDDEYVGRPRKKAKKGGGFVSDFLFFREFIAPWVVKILFWIGVLLLIVAAFVVFAASLISGNTQNILISLVGIVVLLPIYMLLLRVYAELILLGFAIYDRLGEIRDRLSR